jgi:SnoaL-like domain
VPQSRQTVSKPSAVARKVAVYGPRELDEGQAVTPEDFPSVFAHGWGLPKPEPFLDYFRPLIHDRATFTQPMFPDAHGPGEIESMFRRLFVLFPDLVATPRRSAARDDIVFIESDCTATLNTNPIGFPVCDLFVIEDGKVFERRSYSNPLPVLRAVFRRPSSWTRAARSRIG